MIAYSLLQLTGYVQKTALLFQSITNSENHPKHNPFNTIASKAVRFPCLARGGDLVPHSVLFEARSRPEKRDWSAPQL